jgi:HlyD family secretion protein
MPLDTSALNELRIDRHSDEPPSRRGLIIAIIAALLVLGAIIYFFVRRPDSATVHVAQATEEASASSGGAVLNASGYVTARRQATVSSKVSGKVTEVLVEEGMPVQEGQVLARIDATMEGITFRLAEAQVSAARSALEETRVRIREAEIDYRRAERLAGERIASQSDLDKARAQLDALRARLVSQQDQLTVADRQLSIRRQDVSEMVIRAPFAGIVVSKNAQPGEMISPNSAGGGFTRTGICTIVDMASLEVEVDVNESYINRVSANQKVTAVLDSYPDWKIPAHVITVIPTADRQKATVKVRIGFDQRDARILPDMGVKVSFESNDAGGAVAKKAVLVPRAAVRRDGERDVVFVVADSKLERRAVVVQSSEGDQARIASGVTPGETVVIGSTEELKDGQRVRVEQGEKP